MQKGSDSLIEGGFLFATWYPELGLCSVFIHWIVHVSLRSALCCLTMCTMDFGVLWWIVPLHLSLLGDQPFHFVGCLCPGHQLYWEQWRFSLLSSLVFMQAFKLLMRSDVPLA